MTDAEIACHWRTGFVFWHVDGGRCRVTGVEGGLVWFTPDDGNGATTAVPWDQMARIVGDPPAAPKLPTGRFIEVPYWSWGQWAGFVWPPGQGIQRPRVVQAPSADAVRESTGWLSIDAYRSARDRDTCPKGMAWLVPDEQHRLKFFTGVLSTPVSVNARGGSRWRW